MPSVISKVLQIGISPDMSLTEKRSIRFVNFGLLFAVGFCSVCIFLNLYYMGWIEAMVPTIFLCVFLFGFHFQKRKMFFLTKLFTLSIALFGIMISCWLFSLKGNPYFMFLLSFSVGLVFFPDKTQQRRLLILHFVCLGVTIALAPYIPAILEVDAPFIFGIFTFVLVVCFIFIVVHTFTTENQLFEDKTNLLLENLKVKTIELEKEKKKVEQQAQKLKIANANLQKEIQERKEIEKRLVDSNEELQQFVYIASHDLKEPLRTIASFTQLIGRDITKSSKTDTKEYYDFVVDGVSRMSRLLDDLLIYSRVGRNKAIEKTTIDPNQIIELVQYNLQNLIQRNKGTIEVEKPLPIFDGNRTQIIQLFQNIISNALKFKGNTPPVVTIEYTEDESNITFHIRDNGIGIPENFQKDLFAVFQRLHSKAEYEGTGIGLAICKKVIQNHGGKIWLESELNVGTSFFFTFPKAPHKVPELILSNESIV